MAFTTHRGPIRSGTQHRGTVAGGRNTGLVVLAQMHASGDLTGTVVGNTDVQFGNLPKGAVITDITVDQTVAAGTGTTTVSVGSTSGGAELMAAVATSAGGRFRGTATAATQAAWTTSLTADTPLYVRVAVATGTLTAGAFTVLVSYIQRGDAGAVAPNP